MCDKCFTGLFVLSASLVAEASRQRKALRASKQFFSHYIILKMACITGLPNVLAFSIVFIPHDWYFKYIFDIIYSIIYGLQGTLLSVAFITSNNVWKTIGRKAVSHSNTNVTKLRSSVTK